MSLPPKPISYKGVYAMHKYWSKKPPNVVSYFIQKYSEEGDIILDPFVGSGVTISEAIRSNRRGIGSDLNPIAIQIARCIINPVNTEILEHEFNLMESELGTTVKDLYSTECDECKSNKAITTHMIFEDKYPTEVWYGCSECNKKKIIREPTKSDLLASESPDTSGFYFPNDELFENKRINAYEGMKISDLFTPRAQVMISTIWNHIQSIEDTGVKEAMMICFTGSIAQASKMVFVINKRKGKAPRKEVGSWVIGYWTPNEHFEINAWNCFKNRFKRILKGKNEIEQLGYYEIEKDISSIFSSESGYCAMIASATNLPVEDQCVDYIFTDPPHGNRQPYLELSLMWNSWLNTEVRWDEEIIESEAKTREKDSEDYRIRLLHFYKEANRVLKENGKLTICFNSLNDKAWKSLIFGCLENGFELIDVCPLSYSATSVVQDNRNNALKTDFALTFVKTNKSKTLYEKESDEELVRLINESLSIGDRRFFEVLNHVFTSTLISGNYYPISVILHEFNSLTELT